MLTIASINLNKGFPTAARRARLFRWLLDRHVDVLVAQEPWLKRPESFPTLEGFRLIGGNARVGSWLREVHETPEASFVADYCQRIQLSYAALFSVYLDAYSQLARAEQLGLIKKTVSQERDRPVVVVGDFNLAPRGIDGLTGGKASSFNSARDRRPLEQLMEVGKLLDATRSEKPEYTIERVISGIPSAFRCDLALVSAFWLPDVDVRYDHSVRTGHSSFTDHSALLLNLPVSLPRSQQRPMTLFPVGGEDTVEPDLPYSPHKTAKARLEPSPIARSVVENLAKTLSLESVLDYGCGRGRDVLYYRESGLDADGYDPHTPFGWAEPPEREYDLVCLVFVANVLSDPSQRIGVLREAARRMKASGVMLVAVRSPQEIEERAAQGGWPVHHDGYWSGASCGTFQKGISESELVRLADHVGLEPLALGSPLDFGPSTAHVLLRKRAVHGH